MVLVLLSLENFTGTPCCLSCGVAQQTSYYSMQENVDRYEMP